MTVQTITLPIEKDGNDAATVFSFSPLKIFSEDELQVVFRDTDDSLTTLTLGTGPTNYSVQADFPGDRSVTGSIIYPADQVTPMATGTKLFIAPDMPFTQELALENQGGYLPALQEGAFDRAVTLLNQIKETLARAVVAPFGGVETGATLLAAIVGYVASAAASAATATAQAVISTAQAVISTAQAVIATTQAGLASDNKGYAAEWANNDEDVFVSAAAGGDEVDDYSSKHHSIKAAALLASTVLGGAVSTDNAFAIYNGTNGKLLKDGGITLTADAANFRVGYNIATPLHQQHVKLIADDNIFIDGRTNPRTITLGAERHEHTAGVDGTRAIHIDVDSAGFGDTSAMVIRQNLLGSSALIRPKGINFHADVTGATNAHLNFLECSITGVLEASMHVDALDVWHGMGVIDHHSGATSGAGTVFKYDDSGTAYTDITTEAGSDSSDTTIFDEVDDYVYWGNDTQFGAIEAVLATGAGNPGIKPTFEYSKGASVWETLSVSDDTNGFRENGNIFYTKPSDWAVDTVNAVSNKYWVRIKRTSNCTVPTEDTLKIIVDTSYGWDKDGEILSKNVKKAKLDATIAPTVNDDNTQGYEVGSNWIDQTANASYKCVDDSTGAAIWNQIDAAAAGAPSGGTQTSSGTDITLTSGSDQVQGITMTAADLVVNLPDATTLTEGAPIFVIKNEGTNQFKIALSSSGNAIATLKAGQTVYLSLVDNSAVDGVWFANNGNFFSESLDFTHQNAGSSLDATGSSSLLVTALSDTKLVFAWSHTSLSYVRAATINSDGTLTLGSTVASTSAAQNGPIALEMISDTQALLVYQTATAATIGGVVISVSGVSCTYNTYYSSAVGFSIRLESCRLSSTLFAMIYGYSSGNDTYMLAIGVSGTVVTIGGKVLVQTDNAGTYDKGCIVALTATRGIVAYRKLTASGTSAARNFSISGTSTSVGTEYASIGANYYNMRGHRISDTRAVILSHNPTTTILRYNVFEDSGGATITAKGAAAISTSQSLSQARIVTIDDTYFIHSYVDSLRTQVLYKVVEIGINHGIEEIARWTIANTDYYIATGDNRPFYATSNGLGMITKDSATSYPFGQYVDLFEFL